MTVLICPPGSADAGTPVSFGDHQFQPYRPDPHGPWLVDVPPAEAVDFLKTGGFRMAESLQPAAPDGMVLVHHPGDPDAVPGDAQPAEEAPGHWWVPAARVAALLAHGFLGGMRKGVTKVEAKLDESAAAEAPKITNDGGVRPVRARKDLPPDPPGTPHPDAPG